ncbi:ABC transporter permease [Stakelama marina]|uniref:FtsX-like permease family protein n=1 Tax=Stakelama marina TaxID=2826939 RepID=A0A8T4ICA2_9SPHN|nr:FtsX-like permease family protein [Stakelama marina]MBR0552021.1 FtsX-like permease family protein [Stakelama marina]
MRALDLKLFRDLWRMRGQVVAIALVLSAATATYVLSVGVHQSLVATRDAYYARNHFADVFAGMTRAPRSIVARVAEVPGVRRAQGGIVQYARLELPLRTEPIRALVSSVDEMGRDHLNALTLSEGRLPRPDHPEDVVVDEAFAKANALHPGDTIAAQIYGRQQILRIVGTGLAPNYIYALPPGDIIPDERRFGILWMGRKGLEAATDRREAINTLSLTLEHGASEAEVIRKVDTILEPYGGTGAYGRKDHLSHAFLDSELQQLSAMTRVIPPIFLLVATFLVYIVLGRMIRTERGQIGLIKAFGYSNRDIGWHYLKFALAIAVLAIAIGSVAGIWMGRSMTALYAEYYHFPFLDYRLSPGVFVGASLLSVGAAALGAIGGARSAGRLSPAVAMLPPPPPIYRAGAVERLGRWAGLTTIGEMIVRHVARWPLRSAITVIGVSLSMGLLFATVQFIDSSHAMLDQFFGRAQRQSFTVTFTEAQNEDVIHALGQIPGVMRVEATRTIPVKLRFGNRSERTAIESVEPDAILSARIDMDGQQVEMPPAGLMLSRQLAKELGVQAGDRIEVEQLGGRRTRTVQPVARIVNEIVGARAYAENSTLRRITRDAAPIGAALLKTDPAARDDILARLRDMPVVLGVTERDAAFTRFSQMIEQNILTMIGFYVAFASAIAVGVVYNSARILFSERAHELATLRVLGYQSGEVGIILLGEIALLVVLALPPGCLLGYGMAKLMLAMFSSDLFRLPFAASRASYGLAAIVVLIAGIATALVVARRVMRLDMVRVLKARD